jgi:hypothetical protein
MKKEGCSMSDNKFTEVGTNIDEVRKQNAQSGLSYNEAKAKLAQTTRGKDTKKYSNTKIGEIRNRLK